MDSKSSRAVSCAECRRLKIKCDRTVPCSSCRRRGTAALCPEGTLPHKAARVLLASTPDLPSTMQEQANRIRDLEVALGELQALHHSEPHPLLRSHFKGPVTDRIGEEEEYTMEEDEPPKFFGALMISEQGSSRFFGGTSCVEWTMLSDANAGSSGIDLDASSNMQSQYSGPPVYPSYSGIPLQPVPPDQSTDFSLLPFPPLASFNDIPEWRKKVTNALPKRELAEKLVNAYYGQAAWESAPILRTRFVNEFFGPCYDNLEKPSPSMHELGFIYAVFAIGALHTSDIPSHDALAQQYITFSEACLKIDDYLTNTSVTVIDTLLLHITYYYTADEPSANSPSFTRTGPYPSSAARAWVILGVAMRLAIAIGLHRDPTLWGLPANEVARRRRTIWELVTFDLWTSLATGRPPMLSRQYIDAQIPPETPEVSDPEPSFYVGRYHFSDSCLWDVINLSTVSARQVRYSAVLELDSRVRRWKLPDHLDLQRSQPTEEQKTLTRFRSTTQMISREITLLCLHRCYSATALLSPTFDLFKSPYSRSVLSAYASSCTILSRVRELYEAEPVAIMRFGQFWTNAFSAAVILAAIVIRAPDCSLAPTALNELDLTVKMYQKAQAGYRARRGLPTLLQLHSSAHSSMNSFQQGTWTRNIEVDSLLLQRLGGSGAILHHPTASEAPERVPLPPTAFSTFTDIEPRLDDYLRSFNFGGRGNQMEGEVYGPTSDEFLHALLADNSGGLSPHTSGGAPTLSTGFGSQLHINPPTDENDSLSEGPSNSSLPHSASPRVEPPPSLLSEGSYNRSGVW